METPFSFRVKIGEQEIEISGTRDDVMKTLEELPRLMENVQKAFELTKNKETVQSVSSVFPSISSSSCSEAVLQLLTSDWAGNLEP